MTRPHPRQLLPTLLLLTAAWLGGPAALRASSVVAPTFSELVAESATIARVEVKATTSLWTDSPNGRIIKTLVTFAVLKPLRGHPAPQFTLAFLGGEVGDDGQRIPGMPEFRAGQTEILFIAENGQAMFCPLVGFMYGRYRVETDADTGRLYIARNDGTPLRDTSEVKLSQAENWSPQRGPIATALSLASFEEKIMAESELHAR